MLKTILEELAHFEMGQAPPGKECNKNGEGTVFVKAGEFGELFPVEREWTTKPLKFGKNGDVFICVVGATAGKLNLGIDCAIGRSVAAIRPKSGVDTRFIYYQLQPWVMKLRSSSAGSAQGVVNKQQLREIPIYFVSHKEQTRIVAEIEKQFSRLDEAVANLKRVKANLKRYKAAVLKAAVEGKLTEEWRKTHVGAGAGVGAGLRGVGAGLKPAPTDPIETGAELLERILEERHANWQGRGKYKEPVAPDTSGLPELPEGWVWASVEGVALNVVDCPHSTPKWTEKGQICVRTSDFEPGRLNLDKARFVSSETFKTRNARLVPQAGDVLYSREGGILGIACEIPLGASICLGQRMLLIRPSAIVRSAWITNWLNSQFILQRVRRLTGGSASPHLNVGDIRAFPIPLPPLAEQHQIVAEVERRLSIVAEAEAQVDANLRRADHLRQSILKQAFSGQLVPQNPSDEPASVLLERIRKDVGAIHESPSRAIRKQNRAIHESPLWKPRSQPPEPVGAIHELPLHAPPANSDLQSLDAVIAAILDHMQPSREYSRADLVDALGLSTDRWNAAIQELKRRGRVQQEGERRGARYRLGGLS